SRKQRTTRHVALTPFLKGVLQEWLADHPGGRFLFCQDDLVARSKKRSRTTGHKGEKTRATSLKGRLATVRKRERAGVLPLTKDEAHDHFQRTLAGSKWAVLRGFHVLRHSFISCLAAAGGWTSGTSTSSWGTRRTSSGGATDTWSRTSSRRRSRGCSAAGSDGISIFAVAGPLRRCPRAPPVRRALSIGPTLYRLDTAGAQASATTATRTCRAEAPPAGPAAARRGTRPSSGTCRGRYPSSRRGRGRGGTTRAR